MQRLAVGHVGRFGASRRLRELLLDPKVRKTRFDPSHRVHERGDDHTVLRGWLRLNTTASATAAATRRRGGTVVVLWLGSLDRFLGRYRGLIHRFSVLPRLERAGHGLPLREGVMFIPEEPLPGYADRPRPAMQSAGPPTRSVGGVYMAFVRDQALLS